MADVDFDIVAADLMFGVTNRNGTGEISHVDKIEAVVEKHKLRWRTNRGPKQLNHSIRKAFKAGGGKVERELGWLALYLSLDIFKKKDTNT